MSNTPLHTGGESEKTPGPIYAISLGTTNAYIAVVRGYGVPEVINLNYQSIPFDTPIDLQLEQIAPLIFKKLSDTAANPYSSERLKIAVVTVRPYLDSNQRNAVCQAWEAAGFEIKGLIPEPSAAAIAYGLDPQIEQTILVYDLGGGQFDATVLNISDGTIQVVATASDRGLGGQRWNDRIIELLKVEWQAATGSLVHPWDDLISEFGWDNASEDAKRVLTHRDETDIHVGNGQVTVHYHLTIKEFDKVTRDLVDATIEHTSQILDEATRKGFADIDKIFLAGGSSYMRQVRSALEQRFDVAVEVYQPELAVIHGAARYGSNTMFGEEYGYS